MKVLITGAAGLLGRALHTQLSSFQISVVGLSHSELDITDHAQIEQMIDRCQPQVVINCAAYTRVDDAEADEETAFRINAVAAGTLAEICARAGVRVVYPSTDYVFDGARSLPWTPEDACRPLNAYGRSKAAGEAATRAAADHLVIRTSWLFGAGGPNFVRTIAARLRDGGPIRVVADQTGRPTYAADLARAIGALLMQRVAAGTYHVANTGATTWLDFAREIAALLGSTHPITRCSSADFVRPARRPSYSVLDTTKTDQLIGPLRDWRTALAAAIESADY